MLAVPSVVTEDRNTLPIHVAATGVLMDRTVVLALTDGYPPLTLLAGRAVLGNPIPVPPVAHFAGTSASRTRLGQPILALLAVRRDITPAIMILDGRPTGARLLVPLGASRPFLFNARLA